MSADGSWNMDRLNIHRGMPHRRIGRSLALDTLTSQVPVGIWEVVHGAERSLLHGLTDNHEYTYAIGTMYMNIIQECKKFGDHIVNVVKSRMGEKQNAIA